MLVLLSCLGVAMDYDPIVLAAVHSSAKELLTESMFREQSKAGL